MCTRDLYCIYHYQTYSMFFKRFAFTHFGRAKTRQLPLDKHISKLLYCISLSASVKQCKQILLSCEILKELQPKSTKQEMIYFNVFAFKIVTQFFSYFLLHRGNQKNVLSCRGSHHSEYRPPACREVNSWLNSETNGWSRRTMMKLMVKLKY